MMIGDPGSCAIDYDLPSDAERPWLNGSFSYVIRGERIGDFAAGTSLAACARGISERLRFAGNRADAELFSLPATEAFARLDHALFADDARSDEECARDWDAHERFLALPPGIDIFDRWKAFLIEDAGHGARLLVRVWDGDAYGHVVEHRLALGEFDAVGRRFIAEPRLAAAQADDAI